MHCPDALTWFPGRLEYLLQNLPNCRRFSLNHTRTYSPEACPYASDAATSSWITGAQRSLSPNSIGGAKLKVGLTSPPTEPLFQIFAIPTRAARSTDPPRAARRRFFWVGTPDRPTLFRPAGGQKEERVVEFCVSRPTFWRTCIGFGRDPRPTDATCSRIGSAFLSRSSRPTDPLPGHPGMLSLLLTSRRPPTVAGCRVSGEVADSKCRW